MRLPSFFGILVCKALRFGVRLGHRGGTAFPGRIALQVSPQMLSVMARDVNIVVVTGTNGKTTSSRMLEQAFVHAGLDCLANRSGANLISGITTEFAMHSTLSGHCKKPWAVIECDEAAARRTLGELQPKVVVVTNLFRDQLDRYGEVTHTLDNIRKGLEKTPDALLCLNADCSLTASLADDLPNRVIFYGLDAGAATGTTPSALSDATHCIRCRTAYTYDYVTYGHLGGFRCPNCGYARHDTDIGVTAIQHLGPAGSEITIRVKGQEYPVHVNLPAIYNIYNAAGSIAAAVAMGISVDNAIDAVGDFHCGFGRMEDFDLGAGGSKMMLVKNPAGCNQVLSFLYALNNNNNNNKFDLVLLLNDNSADGTDISWIWDVSYELLAEMGDCLHSATVSGIRASDLYVRLKYAGVPTDKLSIERDYEALCEKISHMDYPVYIIPTYTAMLDFRAVLVRHCGGTDFWEG